MQDGGRMKYRTVRNAEALCGTDSAKIQTVNTTGIQCKTRRKMKKDDDFGGFKRG